MSLLKKAGGAISGGAKHAGGVVSGGAKHAGGVVSGGAHHAGGVISGGAHHAGGVISHGAHHAGGLVSHGFKHSIGVITHGAHDAALRILNLRPLREREIEVAHKVFGNSVPLSRVVISPLHGKEGRPFTIPGSMLTAISAMFPILAPFLVTSVIAELHNKYIIFFGKDGHRDALDTSGDNRAKGQTFIHELTHVWQGHNDGFSWKYVFQSIWGQCQKGNYAYKIDLKDDPKRRDFNDKGNKQAHNDNALHSLGNNPQWSKLGVEQQATVIEAWYAGFLTHGPAGTGKRFYQTMDTGHPAYPYLETNIRRKSPTARNFRTGS